MTGIKELMLNTSIAHVAGKVFASERISEKDALDLYNNGDLGQLGYLANFVNSSKSQNKVFYNKNIHIEPTNICENTCVFCSYAKKEGAKNTWFYTKDDILEKLSKKANEITEVHIVGGLHRELNLRFYTELFEEIRKRFPHVIIKALTAEEIFYLTKIENITIKSCLESLIKSGLQAIPGGGAEIFAKKVRERICPSKLTGQEWLDVHEEAHNQGLTTNATMLYGHVETLEDRIDHLSKLRDLQDITDGFNAFIPLKYKSKNNLLLNKETTIIDDLKTYAISRIFLDNMPHLKAYWPMMGKDIAELMLSFGVDDLDGTIDNSTKIYSMAGAKEQRPSMGDQEIRNIIERNGRIAIERDSFYNEL